jgi:hypothetical protein
MSLNKAVLSAFLCFVAANTSAATVSQADITSKNGITIGGAIGGAGGKFVPWGGSVTLTEADAFIKSNGHCAFNVAYDMVNTGSAPTAVFKNWLVAKGTTVAINSNLSLGASSSKLIYTQPYLPQGTYELALRLDAENSVAESNEINNILAVKVNFEGACGATPAPAPAPVTKPDLVAGKGIVVGGKSAAWGGTIALKTADTFLQSNGKCAVNIFYDVANTGNANASTAFVNRLYSGNTLISQQSGLSVDAGKTKTINTQAYIVPGMNQLRLVIDADNAIAESNEANNVAEVKVALDSSCGATQTRK